MKKYWIESSDTWKDVPMAFWIHKEIDSKQFYNADNFDPPAPSKVKASKYRKNLVKYLSEIKNELFK